MLYERIEITDYQEDSIEPISTDECRVRFELSGRPPKAWRKIFRRLMKSPTAQKPDGIGTRVSLSGNRMTLRTTGKDIPEDMRQLKDAVGQASDDFETQYEAALESQEQIALFLQKQFPKDEAEEAAGA